MRILLEDPQEFQVAVESINPNSAAWQNLKKLRRMVAFLPEMAPAYLTANKPSMVDGGIIARKHPGL